MPWGRWRLLGHAACPRTFYLPQPTQPKSVMQQGRVFVLFQPWDSSECFFLQLASSPEGPTILGSVALS